MDLIAEALWSLFPVALLGPGVALGGRHVQGAAVAAYGPSLVCFVLVVIAFHTSWGLQRVAPDAENTNAMAMIEALALFFVVGTLGLALGWGVRLATDFTQRRSRSSA